MPLKSQDAEQWIDKTFDFAAARQRLIEEGKIVDIKTAFGTVSLMNHPILEEYNVQPTC